MTGHEMRFPHKLEEGKVPGTQEETPLVEAEVAHSATRCESRVQSSPHVSQGLAIPSEKCIDCTTPAPTTVSGDIALAGRDMDYARDHIACCLEVALEQHVHVFADGSGIGIPSTDLLGHGEWEGVHGGGDGDPGAWVHSGQAGEPPEQIGASNESRTFVRIAVEDDRTAVERPVSLGDVRVVQAADFRKVVAREVRVR